MDKYCKHQKICYDGKNEYSFFTWSIPEVSFIQNLNISTVQFKMQNGCTYYTNLSGSKDKITFNVYSSSAELKCYLSIIMGSKTILFSRSLNAPTFNGSWYQSVLTLPSEEESFQKLKQNSNDNVTFTCKIIHFGHVSIKSMTTESNTSTDSLYNLRPLAAVLKNSSESSLKEQVVLRAGEETETVSKAVLCAYSPVFAKMFENDMKESKENVVAVTDIQMPVLKVLVSFLYTGKFHERDLEFLCDLYYAADKYEIVQLRKICVDFLLPQISMKNIHRVMKLAFSHNDELLKSSVFALIATNIETWFTTDDWKNLVNNEPKIAAEVLNFFDF